MQMHCHECMHCKTTVFNQLTELGDRYHMHLIMTKLSASQEMLARIRQDTQEDMVH